MMTTLPVLEEKVSVVRAGAFTCDATSASATQGSKKQHMRTNERSLFIIFHLHVHGIMRCV
ncbi:MAG: hypothetical protein IJ418_18645 [Clostridia bacterium]|nr:hypothetical protein [Clostridia bacterium]